MVEVMISGLPQVSKLWLGVSKGMLPVKHLAPKILIAVNYCGRQLARWFVWVATTNHKKEGATPHPRARFGVRVGTWNLNSMSEKGGKDFERTERMISVLLAGGEMERTGH